MPRRYDEQLEAELVAREDTLKTLIADLGTKCAEMQASDLAWDENRQGIYDRLNMDHSRATNDLMVVKRELSDLRLTKPASTYGDMLLSEPTMGERFIRRGRSGLTDAEKKRFQEMSERDSFNADIAPEVPMAILDTLTSRREFAEMRRAYMAAVASDASSGQDLVDRDTIPTIVESLKWYGGAMNVCRIISTGRGNKMRVPREDDSDQMGAAVASQGTAITENAPEDITYTDLDAYTFTSRFIDVTNEMIQDNEFDVEGWVYRLMRRRMGRLINNWATVGTGASQPKGFATAPEEVTAASATAISFPTEIDKLMAAIDPAYLMGEEGEGGFPVGQGLIGSGGRIAFTAHHNTICTLQQAKDTDGRPLWQPNIQTSQSNMFRGYPFVMNNDLSKIATGNKTVIFGNFTYHVIRLVQAISLYGFWDSATAIKNTRRYLGFARMDADTLIKPVSNKWPTLQALKQA